MDLIMV